MTGNIRIGSGSSPHLKAAVFSLSSALENLHGLTASHVISNKTGVPSGQISDLYDSLLNDRIDVAVADLQMIPVHNDTNQEIVITALTSRKNAGESILADPSMLDSSLELKLKSGIKVAVSCVRQQALLYDIRPDITGVLLAYSEMKNLEETGVNAAILQNEYIEDSQHNYEVISLHPREWTPAPGSGIIAYLTHRDNMLLRKTLQSIHNRGTMEVSNVERNLLKLAGSTLEGTVGAYCYQDKGGNFHISAVRGDIYKKVAMSQSTSSGLAENVYFSLFS